MAIKCYDGNNHPITHFTQWDKNQKVIVKNVVSPTTPTAHIRNSPCEEPTLCVSSYSGTTLTVNIPNILLEQPLPLTIYVNSNDTIIIPEALYTIRIPVTPREQPEYVVL